MGRPGDRAKSARPDECPYSSLKNLLNPHIHLGETGGSQLPAELGTRGATAAGLPTDREAGCSTSAMTRLDINRAVRTVVPPLVSSLTSIRPRRFTTSTHRPALVAATS